MEWGEGRRTDTPPQVQRRTERTQGREGEGKGAAISPCRRAQRRRQPERRPGCGGQYQPPPTPLSSAMKAEKGEKRNIPLPRRRQAPYHGVGGRRRSAVRQRLFLGCWARRGLRQQEGKRRGREPGGNAADVTDAVPGGGSGCYGGSRAWQRPGPLLPPSRLRAHARVRLHPWGEGNPRTHRPPLPLRRGWPVQSQGEPPGD